MNTETRPEDQVVLEETSPEVTPTTRRPFGRAIFALVAVLLVVASFAAGWVLRGSDEDSPPSYVVTASVVAGDELTDRQQEMVDMTEQYVAAFVAKDGDQVASFMVSDGYLAMPTLGDETVYANDGSLQEWVEGIGQVPNELNYPIAVHDNQVVLMGHIEDWRDWMMLIEFTDSGEVKIVSDTHWVYM